MAALELAQPGLPKLDRGHLAGGLGLAGRGVEFDGDRARLLVAAGELERHRREVLQQDLAGVGDVERQ